MNVLLFSPLVSSALWQLPECSSSGASRKYNYFSVDIGFVYWTTVIYSHLQHGDINRMHCHPF